MSTPSDKTLRLERTKLTPGAPKGRNTTLIMAMIAGLAAAALAYVFISNQSKPVIVQAPPPAAAPAPVPVPVLIATTDIAQGGPIDNSKYRIDHVTPDKLAPNAVSDPQAVLNMVAAQPIKANTQLTHDEIIQPAFENIGLSKLVNEGYRAVTIALDAQSSVAGFVKPGDYVDVLGTFEFKDSTAITKPVLQNVYLMATGTQVIQTPPANANAAANNSNGSLFASSSDTNSNSQFTPGSTEVPNATVMVLPIDAERLVMAAGHGKLMLALRNFKDVTTTPIPAVTLASVTGRANAVPAPPPPPVIPPAPVLPTMSPANIAPPAAPTDQVTVIRGSSVQKEAVPI